MKKRKKEAWYVECEGNSVLIPAKTANAAANKAFRYWISQGVIAHRPLADSAGGWKGVTVGLIRLDYPLNEDS